MELGFKVEGEGKEREKRETRKGSEKFIRKPSISTSSLTVAVSSTKQESTGSYRRRCMRIESNNGLDSMDQRFFGG